MLVPGVLRVPRVDSRGLQMSKAGSVKGRWTASVVREVNPRLFGGPLGPDLTAPHVGVIEIDGRTYLDLRGFPFADRFLDTVLTRIDFSECQFDEPSGFGRVTATDCRFDGCAIRGSISGTFADCRFDGCAFNRAIGWPDTRFARCSFDGASFRGGELTGSVFEDCSFRGCKMPRAEFRDCRFDGCAFTDAVFRDGSLAGSTIARARNNFKYVDPTNVQIKYEFVADPSFPTVDLAETSTVRTVFRTN